MYPDNLFSLLSEQNRWRLVEDYFRSNGLIRHQIDTFNWFLAYGLKAIINNESSIKCDDYTLKFTNIYVEYPTTTDQSGERKLLYPREARDRDLSYVANVSVDLIETILAADKPPQITERYRVPIGKIPIMVLSDRCNLRSHCAAENEYIDKNGHSSADQGGYFIINGKERVLVSQIRKTYNKPLCFLKSTPQKEDLICEMRSMCQETFHSTCIQIKRAKQHLVVALRLKGKPVEVPAGMVFAILGYEEQTLERLLGLSAELSHAVDEVKNWSGECFAQPSASSDEEDDDDSLGQRFMTPSATCDLTSEEIRKGLEIGLFPHLGITSSKQQQAQLLALMVKKYIYTHHMLMPVDNRDDYSHKRIECSGILCHFLFQMLYKKFQKACAMQVKKNRPPDISNFRRTSGITTGILYSFSSGYWGVQRNAYIRTGVSQVINPKVSMLANYSALRRVVVPESKDGKEAKTSELRQIHPSSNFLICPVETPEGRGVGTVLNMALFAHVTTGIPTSQVLEMIDRIAAFPTDSEAQDHLYLIVVNGVPHTFGDPKKAHLINFVNDPNISVSINHVLKTIDIFSDEGRLIRPMFDLSQISAFVSQSRLTSDECSSFKFWVAKRLVKFCDVAELYDKGLAIEPADLRRNPGTKYTFMELHPVGMFGIVVAIIPFADRTQSARNCFYASMVKQAIGYIPCHHLKTETVSHTLNYPQKPLVTTKIAEFNRFNDYPNGINCIVAIMCYTGFNQEDSVIMNKASIERGLFGTMTYNTHSVEEKRNGIVDDKIEIPDDSIKIRDCNYGLLDEHGIVRLRSRVVKGDVLIGKVTRKTKDDGDKITDSSVIVQSGEEGFVDRIVVTTNDGCKRAKVVVAQLRVPEIGDKVCSGYAQKGVIGMIYAQEDMPFTSDGMTPDIIINPNCIPSRMTINQIIATVMGKLCCVDPKPEFRDGTPFKENATNLLEELCDQLTSYNFNRTGAETMYSGFTGRKINTRVFIGPTYYHRLKHMVQDKMHARSHGQVTTLYRQPNCGRSQGGGLRNGQMENDCMLVIGATQFQNERMFLFSDPFQVDICKQCGVFANTANKCQACCSNQVKKCNIPYSFKNLLQELNAMGIKTKIDIE